LRTALRVLGVLVLSAVFYLAAAVVASAHSFHQNGLTDGSCDIGAAGQFKISETNNTNQAVDINGFDLVVLNADGHQVGSVQNAIPVGASPAWQIVLGQGDTGSWTITAHQLPPKGAVFCQVNAYNGP
jgi:hypothetical protein